MDPKGKISEKNLQQLRDWESSKDITSIFETLSKNRKIIRDVSKQFLQFDKIKSVIHIDDLIYVMNTVLVNSGLHLSRTQWKMLAEFADKDKSGMIDFEEFMAIVNNSAKTTTSHPKIKKFNDY